MKIVLDARMYGLEHTGIGRYTINLIDSLSKIDSKNNYTVLLRKRYFNSLDLPNNWKKVLADLRHYSLSEQLLLPKILNKQNADIVHFLHFNVPIIWKGKFVVTLHDMTMHKQGKNASTHPLPLYYAKKYPYKKTYKKAVDSSLKIITPTNAVKKELMKYFNVKAEKIEVIYEGLEDIFIEHKLRVNEKKMMEKYNLKEGKYLFYYGNLYPHKNIERAIEAVNSFNKNNKSKLTIAVASDHNKFSKKLNEFVKKKDFQNDVQMLGFVPDEFLRILLKNSLAMIYPSFSEGFGLQGLESIASGTLLLASDIRVFKEIYKSAATYFNPHDFSSITDAITDVAALNVKSRSKIIIQNQKLIKQYSWSKMAKQTLQLYKNVAR